LQTDASELLGQRNQMVLKGAGGEFERAPAKDVALMGLREGARFDTIAPALLDETGRLADGPAQTSPKALQAVWNGDIQDPYAKAIVLGTAAVALVALGATTGHDAGHDAGMQQALELWNTRH
jgi:anthranilate phosphoribosyltransferase